VAYGQANSWTLGYNLFADVWLGTNLVEPSVGVPVCLFRIVTHQSQLYNNHSSFIDNIAMTSNFGMPTDNTDTSTAVSSKYIHRILIISANATPGWNLFVAAMTQDQDLRSRLISSVHNVANLNITFYLFSPTYEPIHGFPTIPGAAR